ncbi:MAG TPA: hypothetical protein VLX33_02600 [Nitrososphaerales archaeon]|nr:hypothetical protein [Nitrososphaerales archaeon]
MISIHFPSDPLGVLVYIIGLVILWVVASVPVYFSGKVVKGGRANFGDAMGATLGGVVVYYIVFFIVAIALGSVIGPSANAIGLVLGFLAWLAVFRGSFHTSWLGAVGIAILAWIILLVIDFILVALFGNVKFPDFFPF